MSPMQVNESAVNTIVDKLVEEIESSSMFFELNKRECALVWEKLADHAAINSVNIGTYADEDDEDETEGGDN